MAVILNHIIKLIGGIYPILTTYKTAISTYGILPGKTNLSNQHQRSATGAGHFKNQNKLNAVVKTLREVIYQVKIHINEGNETKMLVI